MNIGIPEEMENVLTEIPNKQLETDAYKFYVNTRTEFLAAFYCAKRLTQFVTRQFYPLYMLDSYTFCPTETTKEACGH
jgi:hypothetical protein